MALCAANIYSIALQRKGHPQQEDYVKITQYLSDYPNSRKIRTAYIVVSDQMYALTSDYKRVPDKLIQTAIDWAKLYPKDIEFQEGLFGLLLSRLQYAQAHDQRKEQRRLFREMKTISEKVDYSEYQQPNELMETIRLLQDRFGY